MFKLHYQLDGSDPIIEEYASYSLVCDRILELKDNMMNSSDFLVMIYDQNDLLVQEARKI